MRQHPWPQQSATLPTYCNFSRILYIKKKIPMRENKFESCFQSAVTMSHTSISLQSRILSLMVLDVTLRCALHWRCVWRWEHKKKKKRENVSKGIRVFPPFHTSGSFSAADDVPSDARCWCSTGHGSPRPLTGDIKKPRGMFNWGRHFGISLVFAGSVATLRGTGAFSLSLRKADSSARVNFFTCPSHCNKSTTHQYT